MGISEFKPLNSSQKPLVCIQANMHWKEEDDRFNLNRCDSDRVIRLKHMREKACQIF